MWSFGGKGTASVFRNVPLQRMRLVALRQLEGVGASMLHESI